MGGGRRESVGSTRESDPLGAFESLFGVAVCKGGGSEMDSVPLWGLDFSYCEEAFSHRRQLKEMIKTYSNLLGMPENRKKEIKTKNRGFLPAFLPS